MIDSPEKAYWIGFIWCDGYLCRRERKNHIEYDFKLSLAEMDEEHLVKLKDALDSTHEIKTYTLQPGAYKTVQKEKRFFICNKYFGKTLYEQYGLIANRYDTSKLIDNVPAIYYKDFIRGLLDSDGSISCGWVNDRRYGRSYKMHLSWSTYEELLIFIQDYLFENSLIKVKSKTTQRHKDGDMYCRMLTYCGNDQVPRILNHLYKNATIYLNRKYERYKEAINFKKEGIAI